MPVVLYMLMTLLVAGWMIGHPTDALVISSQAREADHSALAVDTAAAAVPAKADSLWRRTAHGWQQAEWLAEQLHAEAPRLDRIEQPPVHPSIVALLILLFSVASLILFPAASDRPVAASDELLNQAAGETTS